MNITINPTIPAAEDDARVCDLGRIVPVPSHDVPTVMVPPPVEPVATHDLAGDLGAIGFRCACRLVIEGRREYADTIGRELGDSTKGVRGLIAAQVVAWGKGLDAHVMASNLAYRRRQCCACAQAALLTGKATEACAECRAEVRP